MKDQPQSQVSRLKQLAFEAAVVICGIVFGLLFLFSLGVIARLGYEAVRFGWAL